MENDSPEIRWIATIPQGEIHGFMGHGKLLALGLALEPIWGWGSPKSSESFVHFSIETHGDLGDPADAPLEATSIPTNFPHRK